MVSIILSFLFSSFSLLFCVCFVSCSSSLTTSFVVFGLSVRSCCLSHGRVNVNRPSSRSLHALICHTKTRDDHVPSYSCSGPIRLTAVVTSRLHCTGQDNGTVSFTLCYLPRGRK
jgi:hypothetical protein